MTWNTVGTGTGALTPGQAKTLLYFEYNEATNELDAARTVKTLPASIKVGNHSINSGGENFFFTNLTTNINWFPSWTGIKPQATPANQDETGVIPNTIRQYGGSLIFDEINGVALGSGVVDYDVDSVAPFDGSIFSVEFIVEEAILPDDFIKYESRVGNSSSPVVHEQTLTGLALSPGDSFIWDFDHPIEARDGTNINTTVTIAKGSQDAIFNLLQVRPGATDTLDRYVKLGIRSWVDADILAGIVVASSSQTIGYATLIAADTTAGVFTLTVNVDVGYKQFTVYDVNSSFGINSCFVAIGADTFELDIKDGQFDFYFDGSIWKWSLTTREVK